MEHTDETYAINDELKKIKKMVDIVKQDEEVSLEYMKIFEREAMLIDHGRDLERENTRKAKQEAEAAKQKAEVAKQKAEAAEQKAVAAEQKATMAQQQAKATSILELLQEYGTIPEWLKQKIMMEQSIPRLKEWLKASAKSENIDEFLEKTNIQK